jgi:PPK2 family polyphosphate:nucleotide phosphotransferase
LEKLKHISTTPTEEFTKKECESALVKLQQKLFDLQNLFYANGQYGLLIILQGLDTSGKDGTIRHVMSCMNPMGVQVKSFKKPTEEELCHDFLWRIYPHFPAKGMIKVFNRSYYEDIIMPTIADQLTDEMLENRCQLINQVEHHLVASGFHILKFFLHVSKEEQQERIKERLTQPHKRWKFDKEDNKVADQWEKYTHVYDTIFSKCKATKWQIIPADKRWYRNFAVAKILTEFLQDLQLHYPNSK